MTKFTYLPPCPPNYEYYNMSSSRSSASSSSSNSSSADVYEIPPGEEGSIIAFPLAFPRGWTSSTSSGKSRPFSELAPADPPPRSTEVAAWFSPAPADDSPFFSLRSMSKKGAASTASCGLGVAPPSFCDRVPLCFIASPVFAFELRGREGGAFPLRMAAACASTAAMASASVFSAARRLAARASRLARSLCFLLSSSSRSSSSPARESRVATSTLPRSRFICATSSFILARCSALSRATASSSSSICCSSWRSFEPASPSAAAASLAAAS
mmetsp:Transcript_12260/g.33619  ORF Transcript_12260/g.33619 Transcript_12260/m.33619 type:complete len:271 (-) Transcript_12260:1161-1973(-)